MILRFAAASALFCLVTSASAQTQPGPATAPPRAGAQATKPAVAKRIPKAGATAKPSGPVESGPCQLGVIPALGDQFVVQKVGFTVFGNERTEVPIDWGLNDIVVARVRAAAPGTAVRRLAYAKGAFEPYYNPPIKLFHNPQDDLTAVVRQIAANAGCERYLVVVTFSAILPETNQTLDGIGALKHGSSLYGRSSLFTNLSVKIFDGKTFEILRNPNLRSALARAFQPGKQDPLAELDDASFPEPATVANNAVLRDRVRALLSANLDKILPALLRQ